MRAAKAIYIVVLVSMGAVGSVYLAGGLFFASQHVNPLDVEFSTWLTHWQFYAERPGVRLTLLKCAALAVTLMVAFPAIVLIAESHRQPKQHGDARFANGSEVRRSGLIGDDGIIVGRYKGKYLQFPGLQHMLLAAASRTGKGVSVIIPNCLAWAQSMVVLDVKGENFAITSKYRAENGQAVFKYAPYNRQTHRHNDLGYLSPDPHTQISEILTIANDIYPTVDEKPIWEQTARNLFVGVVLYLCETPGMTVSIGEVLRQGSGKGKEPRAHFRDLINERNFDAFEVTDRKGKVTTRYKPKAPDTPNMLSDSCVDALNKFISAPENTAGSILTTFTAPLTEWANPIVDAATSHNDFDLREIRKRKMSVYVCIPLNKLAQSELILKLFYTQLFNQNLDDPIYSKPDLKYTVLLVNDEFPAIGFMPIINKALGFLAGYGFRLLTVVQSKKQIRDNPPRGYGLNGADALIAGHALRSVFTPRDGEADEISHLLGNYTYKSRSTRIHRMFEGTESDQSRPLMLPQELREMSQEEQIIDLEGTKPIRCKKVVYYQDDVFMDRLRSVSPSLRAFGRKAATYQQFQNIWGSDELSAPVPTLSMNPPQSSDWTTTREMTVADVVEGFELEQIALDTGSLPEQPMENTPENIQSIVNEFFSLLDGDSAEDKSNVYVMEDEWVEEGTVEEGKPAPRQQPEQIDLSLLEAVE